MAEVFAPVPVNPGGNTMKTQSLAPKPFAVAIVFTQPSRSESLKLVPPTLTVLVMRVDETLIEFGPYCFAYSLIGTAACCAYWTMVFISAVGTTMFPLPVLKVTCAK